MSVEAGAPFHGELQHIDDIADQLDFHSAFGGANENRLDQATQDLGGLGADLVRGEGGVQVLDFAAIEFGDVGMDQRRRRRSRFDGALELGLLDFEPFQRFQ